MTASRRRQSLLEVAGLSLFRGGVSILSEIDWCVREREHWVILGPNGSGKTSLLKAITGYIAPSSGAIRLLGEEFGRYDWRKLRQHIGLVSSAIGQMISDDETGLEVVASGRQGVINQWKSVSRSERERAVEVLKQVNARHLANRPWLFLSQGERKRILIGRAFMADYRLLILDEPCAGLDPIAREDFLRFLDKIAARRSHCALILVTHHVEEIMPAFTNVLLLKDGRVVESGRRAAVLNSEVMTAAFGTPVRLTRRNGRYALTRKR